MPIHDPGYRAWNGARAPGAFRTGVIATTGIQRTSKSKWLRRLMFFALLPTLFLSIPLFVFEQAARDPTSTGAAINNMLRSMPPNPRMAHVTGVNLSQATPE